MNKYRTFLFYLLAVAAAGYFLWYYLHAPETFIISLIITLALIMRLLWKNSPYLTGIGLTLTIIHIVRLIGYLIPIYDQEPDIRQRYRRNPSSVYALPGATNHTIVTLQDNGISYTTSADLLTIAKPLYQGDTIISEGPAISSDDRLIVTFWDGSNLQLFPQSALTLTTLSPDFLRLTGSRIGITLTNGIVSMYTRRTQVEPTQWYIHAGEMYFSCRSSCIVAYSGFAGSIASDQTILSRTNTAEPVTRGSGTYVFSHSTLSSTKKNSLLSLFSDTQNTTTYINNEYDLQRDHFIEQQWGWTLDSSLLLSTISKAKMALLGIFDRTYRNKYNNLTLYEYMRSNTGQVPSFVTHPSLYEFIK